MKNKFIGINALLNAIKTIFSIIFPLITFPYISRVLGVENIGIYNFSSSIVSYFTLLAGLGISTYAIREGARYRNDRNKISDFCSEVFSINFISTLVSYVILLFCLIFLIRSCGTCFCGLYLRLLLFLVSMLLVGLVTLVLYIYLRLLLRS